MSVRKPRARRRILHVIGRRTPPVPGLLLFLLLANTGAALAEPEPSAEPRPPAPARQFRLFPAPPALAATGKPFAGLEELPTGPLLRLPGDPDSVFTLGGPAPSGQPRVRLAVEVNEVLLKVLAPDPAVDPNDLKSRTGGDWKPVDSAGRPYQLRFGARLIW